MDDTPKVNGKFFLDALKDKDISMREMASKMGFNHHAQISRIFKGERRMQLDEAVKFSQILGLPFEAVIAHAGYPQAVRTGPRVRVVGALNGKGEVVKVTAMERAVAPSVVPNEAIAIQARCADTPLAWMDGWVFFCMPPSSTGNGSIGRFCYAKIKDGPAVLAAVRRGYMPSTYNLSGPYEQQNVVLDWAEPITFTRNS